MKIGDKVSFNAPMGMTKTGTVRALEINAEGKPISAAVEVDNPVTFYSVVKLSVIEVREEKLPTPTSLFPSRITTPEQDALISALNPAVEPVATGHGLAEASAPVVETTPAAATN